MSSTPEPGSGVWIIVGAQVPLLPSTPGLDSISIVGKFCSSLRRWWGTAAIGLGPAMFPTPKPSFGVWLIA